jgi:hypothetical protein
MGNCPDRTIAEAFLMIVLSPPVPHFTNHWFFMRGSKISCVRLHLAMDIA